MGDFPFLEHLSLKYLDISDKTKHWTDYLKAHGLANACLARDPTRKYVKRRIYNLESHWYNGSHPKTYSEHQQRIADLKSQLTKLRDKTEHELDILDTLHASVSADTIFSRENILKLLNFSNRVFKMSSDCTDDLVQFSRSVIMSSMDLLDKPPCSFAVIGLGSIARGEATPFSDLEYGFIVGSGFSGHKYFTDLAVESYFCIGNLGESPLKCFFIDELNVKNEKGDKLFVDQPPVNGFKIDGISPKAGNIPTGHGRDGGKRLILTVDELMNLYKSSLMAPSDPKVPGDMSDLLFSPVLVFGHKGGEILLEKFIAKRKVYSVASKNTHSTKKRLWTLATDITNHPFIPEFSFGIELKSSSVQVKSDIFRYPTLLATNLKIISNIDTKNPWDTFQWFYDNHELSPVNHAYLKIMLGLSIFIRTKAYIALGSQYELLSLQPTVKFSQNISDRFHVPQNVFLTLGCLLVPIKRCIETSIVHARTVKGVKISKIIHSMLRDFRISEDFLLKAEVLHFMGNFKKSFEVIESAVGEQCVPEVIKFKQAVLKLYPNQQQSDMFVEKALKMMASLLLESDRDEAALDYFSWLSYYSQSEAMRISWDIQSAQSLITLEKYKSAESQLRQIEIRLRNFFSVEISKGLYTHVISMLKNAGQDKSDIKATLAGSHIVYNMYKLYSEAREGLHFYQQALEDLRHADQILDVRADMVDIRYDQMRVYMGKGHIYQCIRDYDVSESMYKKSISLCKVLYGSHAANHDIASLYHNLANIYIYIGEYTQAEELTQLALQIMEAVYGTNHHTAMSLVFQLGSIYYYQGLYLDAFKLFRQILNFHLSSRSVIVPCGLIEETKYLVVEIYNSLDEYSSAYNFLSAADCRLDTSLGLLVMTSYDTNMYTLHLPSVMRLVANHMSSPDTDIKKRAMLFLGSVCMNRRKWYEALGYLTASLSIKAKLFYHQKTLLSMSEVCRSLMQYKTAVQFSTLVLRSESETPDTYTGEAHYIIGDCYMKLGLYKKSWSHLHSALCLYQNIPKYRSFVLVLAKIHLSIAMLLLKLCRVSEALQHSMKAVQFTASLIADQEKTNSDCIVINEGASTLQDALVLIKAWDVVFCVYCS